MSKSRKAKGVFFNFAIVFLLIILILFVFGIAREYLKQKELDTEVASLQAEIEKLNLDKKSFLNSIDAYQGEFFLEQEARTKFNLKKPGEKVVIIPSTTIDSMQANNEEKMVGVDNKNLNKSLYRENISAWWNYFFGTEG